MKDDITEFHPLSPSVVAVGERRVRAWVGDAHPQLGSTLWVGETPTRIVTLAGGNRVEAVAFDSSSFVVEQPVRCDAARASWPAPQRGVHPLEALEFSPGRQPAARTGRGAARARNIGVELLDRALPLAEHGVTLLLDSGAPDEVFSSLLRQFDTIVCASRRAVPEATHQVVGEDGLALAVAAQWSVELPGAALYVETPPIDLDQLTAELDGITCVVRMQLSDGLEILAETLELGRCDTQLFVREDGTIDITRSESRLASEADLELDRGQLSALREKVAIFGEEELDPEELALLDHAATLEAGLVR